MQIDAAKPLFAWECLNDSPSLATLREFLAAIPGAKLIESLRRARGKGRDDYPVQVLWGGAVINHRFASSDDRSLFGRIAV